MSAFALVLCDSLHSERFDTVAQFVGADESGAFGILPQHAKMLAVLRYGLARFVDTQGRWRYLALPGGVLRFSDNVLSVVAARYFLGDERERIIAKLSAEMAQEDSELHASRITLAEIERSLVRRLSELAKSDIRMS